MQMMPKKFQAFFLCVALSASLAACSGQNLREPDADSSQERDFDAQGKQGGNADAPNADASNADAPNAEGEDSDFEDIKEESEGGQEGALLGPDATDEELLEVLKDDITVVTDDDYIEMVSAFTEHTKDYAGQLYQLEGIYATENENPYITRTVVDGDARTFSRMPLKYVKDVPEEGAWVRVTGIVSYGEVGGEDVPVLEVVVLEILEQQGQAELSLNGKEKE